MADAVADDSTFRVNAVAPFAGEPPVIGLAGKKPAVADVLIDSAVHGWLEPAIHQPIVTVVAADVAGAAAEDESAETASAALNAVTVFVGPELSVVAEPELFVAVAAGRELPARQPPTASEL